ncbi:MAG: class I SAM-dependent methyltransferase [Chloroflexi bacterium]|nr:MAG: class I SAM-dependent methyltransferase [Chloroflexota bacterium]
MKLFDELAEWWPSIAGPDEYRDEAVFFGRLLRQSGTPRPRTLLDLGSGSGNNAFHLKAHFAMTCVDLSPHMQAVSRHVNPECAHVLGDIRSVRLGKTFDAVFVHDVLAHMTTASDLKAVMKTAFVHCRPGGVALFVPDEMRETFEPSTDHGGYDTEKRSLRYVQWVTDPDPKDTTILVDFGFLLKDSRGRVRMVHERQKHGLFPRAEWLRMLRSVGFTPSVVSDKKIRDVFLCRRPRSQR